MKKHRGLIIAGVVLAALTVFCLWYTRPQGFLSITGSQQNVESLTASLLLYSIDYSHGSSRGDTKIWELNEEQSQGHVKQIIIESLVNDSDYRAKLSNLLPFPKNTTGTSSGDILLRLFSQDHFTTVILGSHGEMLVRPAGEERMYLYHADPELFQGLAEVVQCYGSPYKS